MSTVRVIKNKKQYDDAMKRFLAFMDAPPEQGSKDENEFELLQLVIGAYDRQHDREIPITPLDAIRFRMEQAGLTNKDLVPFIGSLPRVSDVLSGRRPLSLLMMRRLHKGLGIPANSLIGDEGIQDDTADEPNYDWRKFPLAELMERGAFPQRDYSATYLREHAEELVAPILRGAAGSNNTTLLRAPLYQSGSRSMDDYALLVWRALVVTKARRIRSSAQFHPNDLNATWLRKVAKLSAKMGGPALAREFLAQHGISLVFEHHFKKTYVDGAAMLDGEHPIVALTLRHDRVDNFWFALLHELIHVCRHLKPSRLFIADNLDDKARAGQQEEDEADRGAQDALIPRHMWDVAKVRLTHSPADALALAEEACVHPAIVAGRVRHETANWRLLSNFVSAAGSVRAQFEGEFA